MPQFESHIKQAKSNLNFLEESNIKTKNFFDWYITTIFYSAVHLINAHTVKSKDLHFNSHQKVGNAINPFNTIPICPVSEDCYNSYIALKKKSRISRYLCKDGSSDTDREKAVHVYEKDFKRSLIHLDTILTYFNEEYKVDFQQISVLSLYLKDDETKHFKLIRK